ncbi:Asp-tRNA(Asn)/Glu-tRNA(Gln) amidotransferase subunit GatB [Candidatus Profftella armatura]|nr:Asp-tRNA(Asn)/Glu-tRNA(Gln) amidotransferase subunit GatB [Candidatus Profftella armatura]QLK13816.1 Asp-tRNA(Asn)/Glu-tRNA(Gln) amidotransferase subunit GatB [Candidatus Profftella armatura]
MQWEVIIGLEIHIQLLTKSKIFSESPVCFGYNANTQINPFDLALPGVLPVLNKKAVEYAIKFGLAINAKISPYSIFVRKNYFYPDLSKGYQISQLELPLIKGGNILFPIEEKKQKIKWGSTEIVQAHLEEDAGKLLHKNYSDKTGIDFNRAGIPLLEIITQPSMHSAQEAVSCAKSLHSLVMWLGICDGNMQNGSFRCDVNISIKKINKNEYGTRNEIKNLNSFRFMEEAINYEINRQIKLLENNNIIVQETRRYDPDIKKTILMRKKENSKDYRYFPDPDLPPLFISDKWVKYIKSTIPELPNVIRERIIANYNLSEFYAIKLTQSKKIAYFFENSIIHSDISKIKLLIRWLIKEIIPKINQNNDINDLPITPIQFSLLLKRIFDGTISNKIAKDIFFIICKEKSLDPGIVDHIIKTNKLYQISDSSILEKIVDTVLSTNSKLIKEFYSGKKQAINALIGKAIKLSNNKANPVKLSEIFKKILK